MRNMRKNNNNKKVGIICGIIIGFFFFPESDTEPYPEGKPSVINKTNTGNFCDMEIPLCICASETAFGVFGFICNSFFLCYSSLLNTKISVLSTFVTNFSSVIL